MKRKRGRFRALGVGIASSVLVLFFGLGGLASAAAGLPPGEQDAKARLNSSPRHGEWVTVPAGGGDEVTAWISYPERSDAAPVLVVIHEVFGLTDWIRSVSDQAAAEGFIAIAPDLLSGKAPGGKGSEGLDRDTAVALVRGLDRAEVVKRLEATARYATALPAARKTYAVMGYCWGGSTSFHYATQDPNLAAAVVYYGSSPDTPLLAKITAPVLGLYGGDDNRVNATIAGADQEMKRLGKSYQHEIYEGAGHGFLRAQDGRDGKNLAATEKAWPRTVAFLKKNLHLTEPR
jgi:carboxymethylenebutenolidase